MRTFSRSFFLPSKTFATVAADLQGSIDYLQRDWTPERRAKLERCLSQRIANRACVFENIRKDLNVAACIRTLDAFGFADFYSIEGSSLSRQEAKRESVLSKGSNSWVVPRRFHKTADCIRSLKGHGYAILATDLSPTATPIGSFDFSKWRKFALVFGNESTGISNEMRSLADATFILPMAGMVESLNVSAALAATLGILHERGLLRDLPLTKEQQLQLQLQVLMNCIPNSADFFTQATTSRSAPLNSHG